MKRNLLSTVLVSCAFSISNAQWFPQNSGITENIQSVQFVNDSTGFVVGDNGLILKTVNGGDSWFQLNSNVTVNLYAISMISASTGWVAGDEGTILKTQNSGNSWNLQISGTTDPLFSIHFLDANHGWASKFFNEVLLTTNSGANWQSYSTGINNVILALFFTDLNTGWVGGWGGTLMKTTDGGLNWSPQYSGTTITRRSLFFLDNNTGWTAGGGGVITMTINGGASWTPLNSGSLEDFGSIYFVGSDSGWVTGGDKVYVTFNGGVSWQNQLSEYGKNFTDLWFENSHLGWVVGYEGSIYKYDNSPALVILHPSGGENYLVGYTENISWQSINVDTIKIEYSVDGGSSWLVIENEIAASEEVYLWEIPNTPSSECLIKITDLKYPDIFDLSDSHFAISREPQLISPNGGENLYFNQPFNIGWNANGSENIKIELSRDNGSNWEVISDSTSALPGIFLWQVTPPRSTQCRIKITDLEFPDFFDVSDGMFCIDTLIVPYHNFPLTPGNKWFFKENDEIILTFLTAEKDTILDDEKLYTQINRYDRFSGNQDFQLTRIEFLRQQGDSVNIYPDSVILDFNWQSGDTIIYNSNAYITIDTVYTQNIFGRLLTTYIIFFTEFEYYSFTDGIGYNTLYASTWNNYFPRYLAGCIIDGIQYGNVTVSLDNKEKIVAKSYRLEQNYPNPFNSSTIISFSIPRREQVTITIYDVSGKKINMIFNQVLNPGEHFVEFNPQKLAGGVYFYQMQAGNFLASKKFLYLK